MIHSSLQVDSEVALMAQVHKLANAGGSVIQIRTREPIRAALTLRKHLIADSSPYREWDMVNGFRSFTVENYADHQTSGNNSDFVEALSQPLKDLRTATSPVRAASDKIHFFVFLNPTPLIRNNPFVNELIQQYAALLPSTNVCILFITADEPIPDVPVGIALVADFTTPNAEELRAVLVRLIEDSLREDGSFEDGSNLTEEDVARITHMGLGLSLFEFETYAALALIEMQESQQKAVEAEGLIKGISDGKTAVVRQSEILELSATASIDDVGGMGRLKDWVAARAASFEPEAREFGVETPKGISLVGVPGTGKSLAAKAIAAVFGVPLVRLDFGRVFSKYVGDSESRVRSALKMVEAMAPCVLFVDEIDKGLGGAGGGGDSGISSRVLGSFLTWLQEHDAAVFTIVTANRVNGLPPELLRRGRFDQNFSVSMPGNLARRDILAIHLRKRRKDIANFTSDDLVAFDAASEGYVAAEIEAAVKDAISLAYVDTPRELKMKHVLAALKEMVPLSKSNATMIADIVAWAALNAIPVEYTSDRPDPKAAPEAPRAVGRIIRPRR